jgi:lysozyme
MILYRPEVISRALAIATGISNHFEGCELTAYPDPGTGNEPWTIARGTTFIFGRPVRKGDTCTQAQADAWGQDDLRASMQVIINNLPVELDANWLGAMTSFVNNVGPGKPGVRDGFIWLKNGSHSTLFWRLAQHDLAGALLQIPLWDKAGGRVLRGLDLRRAAEVNVAAGKLDPTLPGAFA